VRGKADNGRNVVLKKRAVLQLLRRRYVKKALKALNRWIR
jgi:hypothetical protein